MQFITVFRAIVLVSSLGSSVLACGGETSEASTTATATSEQLTALRERWNTAAKTVHASIPGSALDFTWTPSAFPAPTFRGGSHEAYEEFAEILILFYSTGDNLTFAKANGLLTQPFSDGLSEHSGGTTYTLLDMTSKLTTAGGLSTLVRDDTVAKLKTFCPTVGCEAATK
jgi:hypothetical protein